MDFKFNLTLENKRYKGALHYPTAPAMTLALRNILYRHFKSEDINIPLINDEKMREFNDHGYTDLVGAIVDGKLLDSIRINKGADKG